MNVRLINLVLLAIGLLVLNGCATMNKDECRAADWYAIGFEDGAAGRSATRIGAHRRACAEYGVRPDGVRYQEGWDQGILKYCTPATGYRLGLRGSAAPTQCPASHRGPMLEAYHYGKRIHGLQLELQKLEQTIAEHEKLLAQTSAELDGLEDRLVSGQLPDTGHAQLLTQLKRLYQREIRLQSELEELDAEIEAARVDRGRDQGGKRSVQSANRSDRGNGKSEEHRQDGEHRNDDKARRDDNSARNRDDKKERDDRGNSGDHRNDDGDRSGRDGDDKTTRDNRGKSDDKRADGNSGNNHNGRDVAELQKQRTALAKELREVRRQIKQHEAQLEQLPSVREQRQQMLDESKRLSHEESKLQRELRRMYREREELKADIRWLREDARY